MKGESPAIRALKESRDVIAALLKPLNAESDGGVIQRAGSGGGGGNGGEAGREEAEVGKVTAAEVVDVAGKKGSSTIYVSVIL
jgi:hypothetical protein